MNKKISMDQTHSQHIHIDNGGISMSIEDQGLNRGVWFKMSTEYFGYPGFHVSMQLDAHGIEFLDKLEQMIKAARKDLNGINWEERYNQR